MEWYNNDTLYIYMYMVKPTAAVEFNIVVRQTVFYPSVCYMVVWQHETGDCIVRIQGVAK